MITEPLTNDGPRRLAYTKAQACEALGGISHDSLERYVLPDVRIIRRGRLRLIPVAELENWLTRNASHTL